MMYTVEIFNQYDGSIFGKPSNPMTLPDLMDFIAIHVINDFTDCKYIIREAK